MDPNGTVRALHYDDMDLGFVGPKQIGRASEIRFDEISQTFWVDLPQLTSDSHPAFLLRFNGYDEARRFEVFLLETCALNHVNPAYEGTFYRLAHEVRTRFDQGSEEVFKWNGARDGGGCPF